jgi:hypothetical protein
MKGKRRSRYYRRRLQAVWIVGILLGGVIIGTAILMASDGDEGLNGPSSAGGAHTAHVTPGH